jgi:hypothetical protein
MCKKQYFIFGILIIGILFISGCAISKQISEDDLVIWKKLGNEINPGMETLCVKYKRIPKEIITTGHTIAWNAPGGLSGYYRFTDPSDGTMYGSGNWPEEWKKANTDGVVDMNKELPLAYYQIGKVKKVGEKLMLELPKRSRLIFKPPEPFSGTNYYIIIELPSIPPKADSKVYSNKQP